MPKARRKGGAPVDPADPEAALEAGLKLLVRREHAALELARKLAERGFERDAVDAALERARELDYLNETRYAESMARHRVDQGYGEQRIRAELAHNGIDGDTVSLAVEALEVDWVEQARGQLERHFRQPPEAREDEARMLRHLAGRGFPGDVAHRALAAWKDEAP
ncbi:regulatory protein RecX [Thioalkalivibrio sp. ALE11]|uniref:regulatory protein RecX n=1 Tax=Thioalkalivibrio sp. ALE11 TaxID=1265494 RepID=UPI000364977C|nr:regulatory protein RecX [Thioalkalivibrio sp. ALE11]